MLFPLLANIEKDVASKITSRAGKNDKASGLTSWIRVASAATAEGFVMESLPSSDSFVDRYGFGKGKPSGRIGQTFKGKSVVADENDRKGRPSPIIEGLSVEFGSGGLTKKTKFNIKCFTLKQADKLSEYFLEPGYTVLVEWGWNTSDSVNQKVDLSACEMAKFNNFLYQKRKEKDSYYEYGGFLGFITGGGLTYEEGEVYNISVELTTIGEIPAYIQSNKGAIGEKVDDKSGESFKETTIENESEDGDVGRALFMQMYNRLPQQKQIEPIKTLYETGQDSRGNPWSDKGNFINMDDEIRKSLIEDLTDTDVETNENDSSAKIPEGIPLVSNHSYIRLELAFKILSTYQTNMKPKKVKNCEVKSYSYEICIDNTLCRAHKFMFSIDGSKLLIPNTNTPEFNLVDSLTASDPINSYFSGNGVPKKTANLNQWRKSNSKESNNDYAFPQIVPLNEYKWPDGAITVEYDAHTYGYVKDLFINYEFFLEVLGRTNYVNKDLYYEILNGISNGVSGFWQFEITETPDGRDDNKGNFHLAVFDLTLCKPDATIFDKCAKFDSSGPNTPFLQSSFDLNIPAAMQNMITGQRSAAQVNTQESGDTDVKSGKNDRQTLFATEPDEVMKILDSFQPKEEGEDATDKGKKVDKEDEDDIRKANYELFMSKGTVLPSVKGRDDDYDAAEGAWYNVFNNANASIEDILFVGAWNDSLALRKLFLGKVTGSGESTNVLVPIKFGFTTLGVTGIVTGQLFRINDIPQRYAKNAFQVTKVGHELTDGQWKTTVEGTMRNFG